jgi:CheY-like chemotaxis protein
MEEGWKLAHERHPDLIVSEVMLERPDAGFTLAYRLRNDQQLANIPLLLLSGIFLATGTILDLSSPIERQWIKADAFMERPIAPEQLLSKVASLLSHIN